MRSSNISFQGYSVSVSSNNILVGSPRALNSDGQSVGAVYAYFWNDTVNEWYEQKFTKSIVKNFGCLK